MLLSLHGSKHFISKQMELILIKTHGLLANRCSCINHTECIQCRQKCRNICACGNKHSSERSCRQCECIYQHQPEHQCCHQHQQQCRHQHVHINRSFTTHSFTEVSGYIHLFSLHIMCMLMCFHACDVEQGLPWQK